MRSTPRQWMVSVAMLAFLVVWLPAGATAGTASDAAPVCRLTMGPPVHHPYVNFGVVSKTGQVEARILVECFAFDSAPYETALRISAEHGDGNAYVEAAGSARFCQSAKAQPGYTVSTCDYHFLYQSAEWAAQAWRVCMEMSAPRPQPLTCSAATTTPA